jgi:hypothetical protein
MDVRAGALVRVLEDLNISGFVPFRIDWILVCFIPSELVPHQLPSIKHLLQVV